jgi:hypothetical protein
VPFTHDPPDENTADIHRDHVIIDWLNVKRWEWY